MTPTPNASKLPRIELPVNPADAGLADALRAAGRYWLATPANWVLPVLAVALVNLLAVLLLGGAVITTGQMQDLLVSGPLGPDLDMQQLPRAVAGPAAVGLVTIVARWFLVANAIAGLRGREVTVGWVVGSGLRALVADMLVALTLVTLFSLAATVGPVGLLVVLAAAPFGIYLGLRLTFWTLGIFDGSSLTGGATASWGLTRRAVLRVFGWSLAIAALGFLIGIPLTLLDIVGGSIPLLGAVVGGSVEMALSAYTISVMAVLYESQRLRTDPEAYQASLKLGQGSAQEPDPGAPPGPPPPPPGY